MQHRRVGHTGLEVSRIGLGTMQWGAAVDAYEAEDQLRAFVDAGGTLLDTAPVYGGGSCEALLGTLLAKTGMREQLVLAGKAGLRRRGDDTVRDTSRGTLLSQLDATLADLGTDHLDLWQVHVWDEATPPDETFAALEHAIVSGRVRYVGVSNYRGWQTSHAHTWLSMRPAGVRLASAQVEYSLARRDVEHDLVPAATHHGIGVLAWSPLGRGVLTGKYRTGIPADSRAAQPAWESFVGGYLTPQPSAVVEAAARAAEGLGVTVSHVALAWLRDRPGVTSALVGARTTAQLQESLASEDVTLPGEILQALDDVSEVTR